jgi:putative SOS response-associated peptidase YedK
VYAELFGVDVIKTEELKPSYNVAPTDRMLGTFKWGLLPFWAKDRKLAARNINARVETVAEKSSFSESFERRRCLIPADGFYEWEVKPKGKLPHFIYGANGKPLALAGLWSSWKDPETGERVRTCTILTGEPNDLVAPIHDRMPISLPRGLWAVWLDPDNDDTAALGELLATLRKPDLAEHPVSTLVNKVQNNVPELIVPLETGAVDQ